MITSYSYILLQNLHLLSSQPPPGRRPLRPAHPGAEQRQRALPSGRGAESAQHRLRGDAGWRMDGWGQEVQ